MCPSHPTRYPAPAVPACILEPLWDQFQALLPHRQVDHPLGCHRRRIPDRLIFERLIQVLVFGCGYRCIADSDCSATTLRRRRDEWITLGLAGRLHRLTLAAYDRLHGLELADLAADGCITKAPCGGQVAGPSPVDRRKQGLKRSLATEATGLPLAAVAAGANRRDDALLAPTIDTATTTLAALGVLPASRRCTWTPAMTSPPAGWCWPSGGWAPRSRCGACQP
jgi:transposase